ncbi:hypothetical protein [uncultured Deinococcus sp.]|uniref:hypothetical protein n=1 Tax=uncultured Deinococcus sp. TaxID=158789 RepID=UPI00258AEE05|nr:hypothetical protein [uncultured Deinococcus sp.]
MTGSPDGKRRSQKPLRGALKRGAAEEQESAPVPDGAVAGHAGAESTIVASVTSPGEVRLTPSPEAPSPTPDPATQTAGGSEGDFAAIPELRPMYPGVSPFLARFLPHSEPTYQGLHSAFCDLHAFLKYLHGLGWHGYLAVSLGDQAAYVLVYEGRTVAAAAVNASGEQALGELLGLYQEGAALSAHPLPATYAHILSGVGSRAWKFNLTPDFTGLHAQPGGALLYSRGEVVATLPATLPYEGAFPAPLRPQTLILPRSLAGWAHHTYGLTLRGRDAVNPITDIFLNFRTQYGAPGIELMRAAAQGLTPAEYAMRSDAALHDLEPLLQEFLKAGYLREV